MKRRIVCCILLLSVLIHVTPVAKAGSGAKVELHETEWTWEEEDTATFEGTVAFDEPRNEPVVMKLSFKTSPESSNPGEVVFQTVNGKKLTLRKQQPAYTCDPEGAKEIRFTGAWKTPENVYFTRVEIEVKIYSGDESTLLAEKKMTAGRNSSELANKNDGRFRIRQDLTKWTIAAGIATGVVWICAMIRILIHQKRKRRNEGSTHVYL